MKRRRPGMTTLDDTPDGSDGAPPPPASQDAHRDAERRTPPARPRRGWSDRFVKLVGAVFAFAALAVVVAAAAALSLRDTPLIAPPWLKARIEARLDASLQGVSVEFGELALILGDGWTPRLRLRDVELQREGSPARITLSDMESTLALQPLIDGRLQPRNVWLSGAQLRLRRGAEGGFDLALEQGGGSGPVEPGTRTASGADIGALAEEVEALLDLPDLRGLTRIEAGALTLRYEDARSGRAWTVDGGRIVLDRDGDEVRLRGDFALLSGGDSVSTLTVGYDSRIGDRAASFAMTIEDVDAADIATQSPALAWLEVLEAPISGALRVSVDAGGGLGPLNATLQVGEGVIRPNDGTRPIPFRAVRSYFTWDPARAMLTFDELTLDSRYASFTADGALHLPGADSGRPSEMTGQLRLSDLVTDGGGTWPEPVRIDRARAALRLRLDPFRLTLGELSIEEQAGELNLKGEVRAGAEGWDVTLEGRLPAIAAAEVLRLWPAAVAPGTRAWVTDNVQEGTIHDAQIGVRSLPGRAPDLYLGFQFSEARVSFLRGLPPLENLRGHASLWRNRFVAVAEGGHVAAPQGGRVAVAGTSFAVPDVTVREGPAEVQLATDSTITAALSLLDEEPFRFLAKAGRPVTLADGRARLEGRIGLRLQKKLPAEEIEVDVAGDLTEVRSGQLVPGRVLVSTGLRVQATTKSLVIEGPGRIGAVPFDGRFETALGPASDGVAKVTGSVEVSERFVDEFRIGLPPGSLSGAGRAQVDIRLPKGQEPTFAISSDLGGIGLRLAALDWSLPKGGTGRLEVAGAFGAPPRIDRLELSAPGLDARGRVELTAEGQLAAARFDRVRIGSWMEGAATLRGRGPGATPAVEVTGGWVDLRRTELSGGGAGAGGGPIRLALDRLQISDTIALTSFSGDFTTAGGMNGAFTGLVNGAAPINGRLIPQGRRSAVRITSADAGRVLAGMRLLKQGRGGDLDLVLTPIGGEGNWDGQVTVKDLRIVEAPAMAALLSAVSVVGLLEQMAGQGIVFNDVEARFRLTPQQVVVAQSSAVGASLGISMDGVYWLESGQMDMQGVISPLYVVNGIGALLTRKGEGLFGFNFTLKGAAAAPRVAVNPLSLLTPGMFREIFRRPPPKLAPAAPGQ